MDCERLLEGCASLGGGLLDAGAETYRVEDSVRHVLDAYGMDGAVFAIPNALIVTVTDEDGRSHTRLRRSQAEGTDIDAIERCNAVSRRVCETLPPPADIRPMVEEAERGRARYSSRTVLFGYFIGAFFFALCYAGRLTDGLVGGAAGVAAGLCMLLLKRVKINFFLQTVAAAAALAFTAYGLCGLLPMETDVDMAIIGALMTLVPGMALTNFMCELVRGELISGVAILMKALLCAGAIAVGAGMALSLFQGMGWPVESVSREAAFPVLVQCVLNMVACTSFGVMYNIHGAGIILCCLGAGVSWLVNWWAGLYTGPFASTLAAAIVVGLYAEVMARVRKCPITAYRVISFFPLVPGGRIYYAMYYALQGNEQMFLREGIAAVGLAACLAMGSLIANSAARVWARYSGRKT